MLSQQSSLWHTLLCHNVISNILDCKISHAIGAITSHDNMTHILLDTNCLDDNDGGYVYIVLEVAKVVSLALC